MQGSCSCLPLRYTSMSMHQGRDSIPPESKQSVAHKLLVLQTFDELVLLKRGGVIIYSGALGSNSSSMVSYFENIHGVPKIAEDFNPVRPASLLSYALHIQITHPGYRVYGHSEDKLP